MNPNFSRRASVRYLSVCGCLSILLCPASNAQSVETQAKKAATTAGKTISKAVAKATNTGRRTGRKVTAAAGRVARVTGATASKMLATPEWAKLQSAYDYDASAPNVKEETFYKADALMIKLSFTGPGGKPVAGTFMRPKADGTYPCALLPHGLTNNKEIAISMFGHALLAKGIAILALDAPEHGKGQSPNKSYWNEQIITVAVHEGGRNYRRALDYLATRPDIDMEHIGLLGYSLGSITGSILGAVDERIGAFAFCVGGDPFLPIAHAQPNDNIRQAELQVCPSLYIGHISNKPIIMFNGLTDVVIVPPAAKLLQAAAPQPKEVVWYSGGHDVPTAIRTRAVDWLAGKLKGADAAASEDKTKPAEKPADKPAEKPADKPDDAKKQADPPAQK